MSRGTSLTAAIAISKPTDITTAKFSEGSITLHKNNEIKIANKDLDDKINSFISENADQEKQIKEFYGKDENMNNLYEQLLNDKLFSIISEFAINKISEKSTSDLRKEK